MSPRLIIVATALVGAAICGLLSTFTGYEMMDKVNERLPKDAQFDPAGWYWSKRRRLFREYRRLVPHGHLMLRVWLLWGMGCLCMLTCAWSLGFFGR